MAVIATLFENDFQKSNPRSKIKAAILQISYPLDQTDFSVGDSMNIENAEHRADDSWVVQFEKRVDPRSLAVRVVDGETAKVALMEAAPRSARISINQPPLEYLLRMKPLNVIFECAES